MEVAAVHRAGAVGGWEGVRFVRELSRVSLVSGLLAADEAVGEGAGDGTDDGGDPEEPELADGPISDEDGDGGAAGRVNGGIRDGDADEVDERQPESDGQRCEALWGTL